MKRMRKFLAVVLAFAAVAAGFAHQATWMLLLAIATLIALLWPLIPWAAAEDPRQCEEDLSADESALETPSK